MSATASASTVVARAGTNADAILGVSPKEVFTPANVEEAAQVLAEKAREKKSVACVGGGTALELGNAPRRLDAVLRTERLSRVVEHAPSDQVIVVEGGLTLAELQKTVAAHGQRLALDPPGADRATVGGIIATNAFGPARTRYGSVRDLIIGITLVRADGVAAKGGGKVVKNVAGFDLPKMMVGSLGTLGLIATAAFRLHPLPEVETMLFLPKRTARDVRALVAALRAAQLEPAAVFAILIEGRFDVAIRFAGFRSGVEEQCERLRTLVAKEPGASGASCDVLSEADAAGLRERHDAIRTAGPLRAKVATLPAGVETLSDETLPPLFSTLRGASFVLYPTLGLGFFAGEPEDAARSALAVEDARSALSSSGGSLVLEAAPKEIRARVDVWGAPPPAFSLMRSLKARLDPEGRLNPGRYLGGI